MNSASGPRVKLGKFGHQVNSDTHLQTVLIQMRRLLLLMSRLIRIFTVCLVYSNIWNMKQTRSLSEFSCQSEYTRLYRYGPLVLKYDHREKTSMTEYYMVSAGVIHTAQYAHSHTLISPVAVRCLKCTPISERLENLSTVSSRVGLPQRDGFKLYLIKFLY